jgi:hypothetical protein
MSGYLHACEEMDDFFSLYLVVTTHGTFDYGFGCEDKTPWRVQERNNSRNSTLMISPFAFTFSPSSR